MNGLRVYTCIDHDSSWVGGVSVIVAVDEAHARELLDAELVRHGLAGHKKHPYTLQQLPARAGAVILRNGDY